MKGLAHQEATPSGGYPIRNIPHQEPTPSGTYPMRRLPRASLVTLRRARRDGILLPGV